jgi:uncharacterized protein (TIGR02172 family)
MYQIKGKIDSTNAPEFEKEIMATLPTEIDAAELEYISSAGLRVLMKLRKAVGDVTVCNVSPEVYEIFDVTGFTSILTVKKALREISVEGCELIGEGGNGAVYRLDEDKIVKVYKAKIDVLGLEEINREREYARTAFMNGIPSVIAYDMVKVGDSYGVVFEMLNSDTLGHAMRDNPEKLSEYTDQYVELAKKLHTTELPEGSVERTQAVYHRNIANLTEWCSDEEIALMHSIVDAIPEANTVIHNDFHPGNIMINDGELVLIDMPMISQGPPICDLVATYRDMIVAPSGEQAKHIERSVGMPAEMCLKVGNLFFMKYTGITEPEQLKAYYQKLGLLFAFNTVMICGAGASKARELAPLLMDKLLRGVVIPNEQTIKYLYKTM